MIKLHKDLNAQLSNAAAKQRVATCLILFSQIQRRALMAWHETQLCYVTAQCPLGGCLQTYAKSQRAFTVSSTTLVLVSLEIDTINIARYRYQYRPFLSWLHFFTNSTLGELNLGQSESTVLITDRWLTHNYDASISYETK